MGSKNVIKGGQSRGSYLPPLSIWMPPLNGVVGLIHVFIIPSQVGN